MNLDFLRQLAQRGADGSAGEVPPGLFGSSARQAMASPAPVAAAALAANPNPERSYLGGLIKYQRPEGQTGAQRMQLLGATLSDVGAGLGGGRGGYVRATQGAFDDQAKSMLTRQQAETDRTKAETDRASRARAMSFALDETGHFNAGKYMQALAEAGIPLDVSDIADARQAQGGRKVLNTADGPYGYDETTGEGDYIPGPFADQRRELLAAQIEAAKAQGGLRQSQGGYYDAKAKQPYAPRAAPKPSAASTLDDIAAELRRRGKLPR